MDGRPIPGFFYDQERKKYFRIQANHVAPPNSKYSKENVRKEKERSKKRKREALASAKLREQTVTRSPMLKSSHTKATLGRELGYSSLGACMRARSAAFASQLQHSDLVNVKSCVSCGRKDLVFDFAVDAATDALVWGIGSPDGARVEYLSDSASAYNLAAFHTEISSIDITASRSLIATSLQNNGPGNVFVAKLSEPAPDTFPSDDSHPLADTTAPYYTSLGDDTTTLWTTSPSPPGGQDLMAIGADRAAYMIAADGTPVHTYRSGNDVRALSWLSPQVAIGGTMTGGIFLWDTRTWGSSARFQHSSAVTGIRGLGNGTQLVAQGFDSMAVYDVRWTGASTSPTQATPTPTRPPKQTWQSASRPPQHSKPAASGATWSQALLRIAHATHSPDAAMDVWPAADLVASRDDSNVVRVYSLVDGKPIAALGPAELGRDREWVRRLRFVEAGAGRTEAGRPALMACKGASVFEWIYGGVEDDEA